MLSLSTDFPYEYIYAVAYLYRTTYHNFSIFWSIAFTMVVAMLMNIILRACVFD